MSDEGLKVDDVPMTSPLMSVPMGGRSDSQQWCDDCEGEWRAVQFHLLL